MFSSRFDCGIHCVWAVEDARAKLQELDSLADDIKKGTADRTMALERALAISDR